MKPLPPAGFHYSTTSRAARVARTRREHQLIGRCHNTSESMSPQQLSLKRRRWQVQDKENDIRSAEAAPKPGTAFFDAKQTMIMPQVPSLPVLSSVLAQNIGELSKMGFQAQDILKCAQSLHKVGKRRAALVLYEEACTAYDRMILKDAQVGGTMQRRLKLEKLSIYEALATVSKHSEDGVLGEKYALKLFNEKIKLHGKTHPETLSSMNTLGTVLLRDNKLSQAKHFLVSAMQCREETLGRDHPSTILSVGNYGVMLKNQGRLQEAEPYYRKYLQSMERVLGPEHPDTLLAVSNLCNLLALQGKYALAEPLARRDLLGCELRLGRGHCDTAASMCQLARILWALNNYDEAEAQLRIALAVFEEQLGIDHESTLGTVYDLAFTLQQQGKLTDAAEFLDRWRRGAPR